MLLDLPQNTSIQLHPVPTVGLSHTLQFIMAHVRSMITVQDSLHKQISKIKYSVSVLPFRRKEGKNTQYWLKCLLALCAAKIHLGLPRYHIWPSATTYPLVSSDTWSRLAPLTPFLPPRSELSDKKTSGTSRWRVRNRCYLSQKVNPTPIGIIKSSHPPCWCPLSRMFGKLK